MIKKKMKVKKEIAKKKINIYILIVIATFIIVVFSFYVLSQEFYSGKVSDIGGDIDANGEVDLSDAVGLLNYLFRGGEPPTDTTMQQLKRQATLQDIDIDINNDGLIDIEDLYREFNIATPHPDSIPNCPAIETDSSFCSGVKNEFFGRTRDTIADAIKEGMAECLDAHKECMATEELERSVIEAECTHKSGEFPPGREPDPIECELHHRTTGACECTKCRFVHEIDSLSRDIPNGCSQGTLSVAGFGNGLIVCTIERTENFDKTDYQCVMCSGEQCSSGIGV